MTRMSDIAVNMGVCQFAGDKIGGILSEKREEW